ncbi:MAG: adenosylmethionine--8-amino-7-oxononanoate transaminase [Flavipsychrobacter sp.]|nr:adenosylmethionine--8-amino-7-oxononanoate transaminase [Flavipsychrobacter sp.]
MASITERDRKVIWHPYTPMKIWPEAIGIVSGKDEYLYDEQGKTYIDAISSWWVTLHGHANPYIAQKISEQLTVLEHCIFAGFTHEPAVRLAERLLEVLPGNQKKIFYTDNGSTAVEVAIKMALQYYNNKGQTRKRIVALENAYHGDTFGAMSVSGRSMFTKAFDHFLFDVDIVPFPTDENQHVSIAMLEELLVNGDVAAFIVEPLVQGTAGMQMYPPAVLEAFFALCKKHDTLIIADEVMTGFGRTGTLFACDTITTPPDIICVSKGITGGTMPLGVTACTMDVFDAFYDDDRTKALYHGHSYTANPIACTASLASLDLLLADDSVANRKRIAERHAAFASKIAMAENVKVTRQAGTILAIELDTHEPTSYTNKYRDLIYRFFIDKGVLMRPLGNIIYLMPPYCISDASLTYVYACIEELLGVLSTQ